MRKQPKTDNPDEIEYETSVDGNLAILRAYHADTFLERMKPVMIEVTKELIRAGVDFSKVDMSKVALPLPGRGDELRKDQIKIRVLTDRLEIAAMQDDQREAIVAICHALDEALITNLLRKIFKLDEV